MSCPRQSSGTYPSRRRSGVLYGIGMPLRSVPSFRYWDSLCYPEYSSSTCNLKYNTWEPQLIVRLSRSRNSYYWSIITQLRALVYKETSRPPCAKEIGSQVLVIGLGSWHLGLGYVWCRVYRDWPQSLPNLFPVQLAHCGCLYVRADFIWRE